MILKSKPRKRTIQAENLNHFDITCAPSFYRRLQVFLSWTHISLVWPPLQVQLQWPFFYPSLQRRHLEANFHSLLPHTPEGCSWTGLHCDGCSIVDRLCNGSRIVLIHFIEEILKKNGRESLPMILAGWLRGMFDSMWRYRKDTDTFGCGTIMSCALTVSAFILVTSEYSQLSRNATYSGASPSKARS